LKQQIQTTIEQLTRWDLQVATALPPAEAKSKADIPFQIPPHELVPTWPDSLFPTRGDFGQRIKSKMRDRFRGNLRQADLERYLSVSRHSVKLHQKSHLHSESDNVESLCQCSTSLFSITSFYELSNEALVHSSALILGIPLPYATYLKEHDEKYANIDQWGDFLLNDSEHAGSSRKTTHNKFAAELSKIANECGIPTTCKESQLPYRDQGRQEQSRKRADMMTFGGGCVRPNQRLNFTKATRLIMDVTIGHVFDTNHVSSATIYSAWKHGRGTNMQNIINNNDLLLPP
jgi:hypothetical protein